MGTMETRGPRRRQPRWQRALMVAVVLGGFAVVAPAGVATAASTFHITALKPAHAYAMENGNRKPLTVVWAGSATFPITAHEVPQPGCSTPAYTCGPESHKFASGSHTLVWPGAIWCSGPATSGSFTGKLNVYLVDANHHRTPNVTWIFTCKF